MKWFLLPTMFLGGLAASLTRSAGQEIDRDLPLVPSITVVGSGKATAKPDMAVIQVGVVTQAATAAQALEANNQAMQKLFETLRGRGIAETDIQTSNFSVSPRYRHDPAGRQQPEIVGYEVRNQVQVKVRKLSMLGPVLDELVGQGANQVGGIHFTLANQANVMDEARRDAMADARRKAELYAEAAGLELGKVRIVQEQSGPVPMPQMMMTRAMVAESAVPVAPGEQEYRADVVVTYAVKD